MNRTLLVYLLLGLVLIAALPVSSQSNTSPTCQVAFSGFDSLIVFEPSTGTVERWGETGRLNLLGWSPDADSVYAAEFGLLDVPLVEVGRDMQRQIAILSTPSAAFSPTDPLVAYVDVTALTTSQATPDARPQIEILDLESTLITEFAEITPELSSLLWSPDGQALAVIASSGLVQIYDANSGEILSSAALDLPVTLSLLERPQWSPDGSTIVFVVGAAESPSVEATSVPPVGDEIAMLVASGRQDIYLFNVTEGTATLFAENGFQPAWSPDGQYLAYLNNDGLQITPVQESLSEITIPLNVPAALPSWSPDGEQIAILLSSDALQTYPDQIALVTLDGEVSVTDLDTLLHPVPAVWNPRCESTSGG